MQSFRSRIFFCFGHGAPSSSIDCAPGLLHTSPYFVDIIRISFHGPNTNPISHLQIESSKYVKFAPPSKRGACVDVFEAVKKEPVEDFSVKLGMDSRRYLANTANHPV